MHSGRWRVFTKHQILAGCILVLALCFPVLGQNIKVIRTEGTAAIINAGSTQGYRAGGQVWVMRLRHGMWQQVSRARITQVTPSASRIEVAEGAPMVTFKPGDMIVKISLSPRSRAAFSAASERSASDALNPTQEFQKPVGVYVGPTLDMLLPQGEMRKCFDDEFGYGAMLGFQFQSRVDISIRFMYASRNDEWSFWNLQLLGRLYDSSNLFADFGYGICYPSIADRFIPVIGKVETIRMGFIAGAGYPLPISMNKQFEIGFLYHFYPNFGHETGQFLSVHGRLIIRS